MAENHDAYSGRRVRVAAARVSIKRRDADEQLVGYTEELSLILPISGDSKGDCIEG